MRHGFFVSDPSNEVRRSEKRFSLRLPAQAGSNGKYPVYIYTRRPRGRLILSPNGKTVRFRFPKIRFALRCPPKVQTAEKLIPRGNCH